MVLGVDGWSAYFDFASENNIFSLLIKLIIQYGLFLGIISIFALIGFLFQFKIQKLTISTKIKNFFSISGIFLFFALPKINYAILFFLPWVCFYAVLGIEFVKENTSKKIFQTILFLLVIMIIIQNIGITAISLFSGIILIILLIVIFLIFFIENIKFRGVDMKKISKICLILSLLILSIITVTVNLDKYSDEFPYSYISQDEIILGEYLKEININHKNVISYDSKVGSRIAAIGFQPIICTFNDPALLYYQYSWDTFDTDYILENTQLDFSNLRYLLKYGTPYVSPITPHSLQYYKIFLNYIKLDLLDKDDLKLAQLSDIKYIITKNDDDFNYIFPDVLINEVKIFKSASEVGILLLTTENLRLYEIVYSEESMCDLSSSI
ncbi:hypothetical protein ES705_09827 [subsurface metagenome]